MNFSRFLALVSLALGFFVATSGLDAGEPDVAAEIARIRSLPHREVDVQARVFARALTPEQLSVARPLVFEAPPSPVNEELMGAIYERWGQIDGPAAHTHAAKQRGVWRPKHETEALIGWATKDPKAAWDRLLTISNRGADRRYGEEAVLDTIAEVDLSLAIQFFEDLASDRACLLCNASLLTVAALYQGRLSLITETIARMEAGPNRAALRDGYWETLGRYVPAKALVDVAHVSDMADARSARIHLARGWASQDFSSAFDYMVKHFDPELLEAALLPVIQVWTIGAVPEQVAAVIRKLPTNLTERSLLGLVPLLARVDPAAGTAWAVSLPASEIRRECIDRAMWQWTNIDGDAAHAYMKEQTDTETAGYLLWTYLLARVGNNTLKLADLDEVDERFNVDWRVSLLERVSLRLADPTANRAGTFDLAAYTAAVQAREDLNDQQKAKVLAPVSGTQPMSTAGKRSQLK